MEGFTIFQAVKYLILHTLVRAQVPLSSSAISLPQGSFLPSSVKVTFDELTAQKIMKYLSTCKNDLVFAIAQVIALFSIFEVFSAVYTKHCRQEGLPQSFLSADIKLIASLRCNSRSSRNINFSLRYYIPHDCLYYQLRLTSLLGIKYRMVAFNPVISANIW